MAKAVKGKRKPITLSEENRRLKTVHVNLRLSEQLGAAVNEFAIRHNLKLSDAYRHLIELGLRRSDK